jgi:hypothetical protein
VADHYPDEDRSMTSTKTSTKTSKAPAEVAEDKEAKREEARLKRSHEMVGTIVHLYHAAAGIDSLNGDEKAQAEADRRATAPIAAVITSFQPATDESEANSDELVNVNVFSPTGGASPAFGVLLVASDKAMKDDDSRAYCYPV